LAFIGSGFEHSIANATTFSLAALDGTIGWSALARNLVWTVPGNIVGGGVVVGLGYAWLGGQRVPRVVTTTASEPTPLAVPVSSAAATEGAAA
jgi:nitrite transporter NirC